MTIHIREFTEEDVQQVVDLLNEVYKGSYEYTPFNEESVNFQIRERNARILVAEEKSDIVGVVLYRDGYWGEEIRGLATTKIEKRKQIEDILIQRIEGYLKRDKVFAALDAGSPEIDEWIGRGYMAEGGLLHMIATLESAVALPKAPEGIVIRSLKQGEEEELIKVINAGFGWERLKLGVIQQWKNESPPFDEEWIHVAESDGKIVSAVVGKSDTHYNRLFAANRGYLGPAATIQEYCGRNLASTLTCRAMNFLFERGYNPIALHTSEQNAASLALLEKLDFGISHRWKFLYKTLSRSQKALTPVGS